MADSPYYLESVGRVMKVLECFTPETPELRLTDVSQRLAMPKAQALRILTTLESGKFVTRNPETKRYRLGIQIFHLGMIVQRQMDLRRLAHPYLQRLVDALQETARLVVPDEAGPICLDLVESPKGIRVFAQLGMRMPWNAGTSPKLLLAYLPHDVRERILARGGFRRYTDRTVTDPNLLREELAAIRQRGYHIGVQDLDEDATGVSAPIFDYRGQAVGAVNVAGPSTRLAGHEVARVVDLVSRAAAEISEEMGYRPELEEGARAGHGATTGVPGDESSA